MSADGHPDVFYFDEDILDGTRIQARSRFVDIESAVSLTSDPHAWLRSIYARLDTNPAFRLLAPAHQFAQLCAAVAADQPSQAALMREWSVGAQEALLRHLATSIEQTPPSVLTELWRLRKGGRELRCVAHYLASGIDVRRLERDGFLRTQLCRDAPEANTLSEQRAARRPALHAHAASSHRGTAGSEGCRKIAAFRA